MINTMSNVLHDIFSGIENKNAHDDFIKYGKGVFQCKYLIDGKKQKNGWSIKTSSEFVNFLVRACLGRASGSVSITGVIVSTFEVHTDAQTMLGHGAVGGVKKFMGIKQVQINGNVDPSKLIALMDKYPRAFFALSFSTPTLTLKTKAKAPKSAKPAATGEKDPSPEFCSLKTQDAALVKILFFDIPEFSVVSIKHTLTITEIAVPNGVLDPVQMREQSKRRGTITRIATIDGKEKKSEAQFFA